MMNRLFLSLSLFAVLLASCAPAAVTEQTSPPVVPATVGLSATPIVPAEPTLAAPTDVVIAPTEAVNPTPLPVATSRGPNLEATDPRTVNLASGNLQFVEFFRFT